MECMSTMKKAKIQCHASRIRSDVILNMLVPSPTPSFDLHKKMAGILDQIVAEKRQELSRTKEIATLKELKEQISALTQPLSLETVLRSDGAGIRLIAEVKKASPSRGLLCPEFNPIQLAKTYTANGAAAISVLTDVHFQGEPAHLKAVKQSIPGSVPVLRKDFIFDPYQVYETRAMGADALLLIVAILTLDELTELLSLSHRLGMCCLVETRNEAEIETALSAGASIIGINNRNLQDFVTDLSTTERLIQSIPPGKVIVSESGISTRTDLARLAPLGVDAVLVGEALVTAPDLAAKVRDLATYP